MIARVLDKRRAKSGLFLSHFVTSATRKLAMSKGDLELTGKAADLAATRAKLWPEAAAAGQDVTVTLDDKGRVAEIHARLVAQLRDAGKE
jgi:hypothetical protein